MDADMTAMQKPHPRQRSYSSLDFLSLLPLRSRRDASPHRPLLSRHSLAHKKVAWKDDGAAVLVHPQDEPTVILERVEEPVDAISDIWGGTLAPTIAGEPPPKDPTPFPDNGNRKALASGSDDVHELLYDLRQEFKSNLMGLHLDLVRVGRVWKVSACMIYVDRNNGLL